MYFRRRVWLFVLNKLAALKYIKNTHFTLVDVYKIKSLDFFILSV